MTIRQRIALELNRIKIELAKPELEYQHDQLKAQKRSLEGLLKPWKNEAV